MLSSTADHLYWMARSMERAENAARMLDVTYRMSLQKQGATAPSQEWAAMLNISGLLDDYSERFGEITPLKVMHYMTLDEENQASIYNSLQSARENARTVRGTITSEMWEALNATWIEMKAIKERGIKRDGIADFYEWVKERSHLFRGISYGTMLPSLSDVGGVGDYYQWGALLRSLSGFETYRKVYKDVIVPRRVMELLILRADMPRSLHACVEELDEQIKLINGPRSAELQRKSGLLRAELRYGRLDDIMEQGLHEYLTEFLERINEIGNEVNSTYFWPADI